MQNVECLQTESVGSCIGWQCALRGQLANDQSAVGEANGGANHGRDAQTQKQTTDQENESEDREVWLEVGKNITQPNIAP